ncbi:MAG: T9SS type A sorting domain-containing protein, partial [Winogradskyella sp.]
NNETFTTFNPALVLDLKEGINTLRVSTDLDCQGVFEEVIFNTKDFVVSPNPFTNILKINNVVLDENITVNIYSMVGKLVYNKTYFAEEQQLDINTNNIDAGLYIISIQSKTRVSTYKIIKQ